VLKFYKLMSNHDHLSSQGLIALIPAFNEENRIAPVIEAVRHYLPVLVVDDGSLDRTVEVAQSCGAEVLRQVPNQGKGAALRAGFRFVLEHAYDAVITLDADGQHDPQEIPDFLAVYSESNPDLLIGRRDFSQMPLVRRMANTLGRLTFSWAMGRNIPDNQSGYRLLSRRMMESLLDSQEQGFEFEVEMIEVCVKKEYRLDWVPIRTIYAGESSHIQPMKHLRQFLRIVWQTRQTMKSSKSAQI
jgi:glycosyltransferase involved in cell wall biosynthesis